MSKAEMYPDDLRAAIELIDYLNEHHGAESGPLWKYTGRIQVENPEHGSAVGWAVWHGDGFWMFEPLNASDV